MYKFIVNRIVDISGTLTSAIRKFGFIKFANYSDHGIVFRFYWISSNIQLCGASGGVSLGDPGSR